MCTRILGSRYLSQVYVQGAEGAGGAAALVKHSLALPSPPLPALPPVPPPPLVLPQLPGPRCSRTARTAARSCWSGARAWRPPTAGAPWRSEPRAPPKALSRNHLAL